jgi:hypothetical protein
MVHIRLGGDHARNFGQVGLPYLLMPLASASQTGYYISYYLLLLQAARWVTISPNAPCISRPDWLPYLLMPLASAGETGYYISYYLLLQQAARWATISPNAPCISRPDWLSYLLLPLSSASRTLGYHIS